MKNATDVGLQTWEADVTCGVWCQGGSVRWLKTDHPQYTDASDVWVRGDDAIAALESLRAELAELRTRLEDTDSACADYAFAGAHTSREIIEKLHDRIRGYKDELTEARKPDCRTCMNIMGCQVTAPSAITCRDGSEYFAAAPLRLYEKEEHK